jgi:proteasome lid subunit RPN8/RPN11
MKWFSRATSYRFADLPEGPLLGRFLVTSEAIDEAERLLTTYRGPDGDHEGIVFWCGPDAAHVALITTAIAPAAHHRRGGVHCDEASVAEMMKAARELGVAVRAQVHTHPGAGTIHSDGDDDLILMPSEGMLSIIVPHYGHLGLRPLDSLGVHQYQERQWVLLDRGSVREGITEVPGGVDLR